MAVNVLVPVGTNSVACPGGVADEFDSAPTSHLRVNQR
jgi:hypothetical protein